MKQLEPGTLLVRWNKMSLAMRGTPLRPQVIPWVADYVSDLWSVDESVITGFVKTGDVAFVVSSLAAAFEAVVNLVITPEAIGWYFHTDTESDGYWMIVNQEIKHV